MVTSARSHCAAQSTSFATWPANKPPWCTLASQISEEAERQPCRDVEIQHMAMVVESLTVERCVQVEDLGDMDSQRTTMQTHNAMEVVSVTLDLEQ